MKNDATDGLVGGVGVVRIGASPLEWSLVYLPTPSEIGTKPHRQAGSWRPALRKAR